MAAARLQLVYRFFSVSANLRVQKLNHKQRRFVGSTNVCTLANLNLLL